MGRTSAGLLVYRRPPGEPDGIEVLLVHPGGPFWARRDEGVWSVPKGEHDDDTEWPIDVARREFAEELGHAPPVGEAIDLGEVTQKAGKRVRVWAIEGDLDVTTITSNEFEMEWPPKSGREQSFPEVDRAAWFAPDAARAKLNPAQVAFIDRLSEALDGR